MTLMKNEGDFPSNERGTTMAEGDSMIARKAEGAYNVILHILGSPGRYQIVILFLLGLGTLSVTVNDFVSIFYATPPEALYCQIPEHHTRTGMVPDCIFRLNNSMTHIQEKLDYVYAELDQDYCRITPKNGNLTDNAEELAECRGWACDYYVLHNFSHPREWTVISQWGLSCNAYWIFTLSLVVYFAGALVGTLIFDVLTNRMGYKTNIWVWFVMCIVLCVGFGFEKSLWLFVLMRFLLGIFGHGIRYSCVRLMFDLLPSEQRLGVVSAVAVSSGAGLVVLGLLAYLIMDWRFILYGTLVFSTVGLAYHWTVPESLKWLLSSAQTLQAQQVFYKLLAKNRQFVPAGVDTTIANTSITLVQARQHEQSWRIMLRTTDTCRPLVAVIGLCFVCNMVNYGVLLSLPHLGGSIYLNVILSGLLEICGILGGFFLLRKMSLCRILFVTVFLGGLLCLTGGLIPEGLAKTSTVEITRTALLLLGRVSISTASSYLLEMFLRVVPSGCRNATFGLHGAVAMAGAVVGSMFDHMGRFDNRIPFLIFGILCVSCAFLTFSLPVDDFAEKLVLDLQEYVEDRDVNNNVEQLDEEELVFEPLPEMNRSPYVL